MTEKTIHIRKTNRRSLEDKSVQDYVDGEARRRVLGPNRCTPFRSQEKEQCPLHPRIPLADGSRFDAPGDDGGEVGDEPLGGVEADDADSAMLLQPQLQHKPAIVQLHYHKLETAHVTAGLFCVDLTLI